MKKALSILTIILCITGFVACTSNEKTKEVKNDNNINKFIGTYRFDCYNGYHSIIIVKEDGRCLIKKGNRGPEYWFFFNLVEKCILHNNFISQ